MLLSPKNTNKTYIQSTPIRVPLDPVPRHKVFTCAEFLSHAELPPTQPALHPVAFPILLPERRTSSSRAPRWTRSSCPPVTVHLGISMQNRKTVGGRRKANHRADTCWAMPRIDASSAAPTTHLIRAKNINDCFPPSSSHSRHIWYDDGEKSLSSARFVQRTSTLSNAPVHASMIHCKEVLPLSFPLPTASRDLWPRATDLDRLKRSGTWPCWDRWNRQA